MNLTKEEFLKSDLTQVSQIYTGRDNICRCGCAGEYVATSYMEDPRSDVNDSRAKRLLNRAIKLVKGGAEFELGEDCINVVSGNDRAITVYFDEVKK